MSKSDAPARRAKWARLARPAVLDAFRGRPITDGLSGGSLNFLAVESLALGYCPGGERAFIGDSELLDDPVRGPLVEIRAAVEQLLVSGNIREVTDPVALVANADMPKYSRVVRQIRRFVYQYDDPIDMQMDQSTPDAYPTL